MAMDNYQLETELKHLEQVLGHVNVEQRFSLSYWRSRLNKMLVAQLVPSQRARAKRLDDMLRALESRTPEVG
jgi:hypothetical protein